MGEEFTVVLYIPVVLRDGSEVLHEKEAPKLPFGITWHKGLQYDADFWTFKVKHVRVSEDGKFAYVWMKKIFTCTCNEERLLNALKERGWT